MINYITEQKLREQLNISRSTAWRYKTKLGLPHVKVAGKCFYNIEDLKIFFEKYASHLKLTKNERE
jgi:hypothetical protein